jgi:hypothetical protein
MTDHLWDELPVGFLRKSAKGCGTRSREQRVLLVAIGPLQTFERGNTGRQMRSRGSRLSSVSDFA